MSTEAFVASAQDTDPMVKTRSAASESAPDANIYRHAVSWAAVFAGAVAAAALTLILLVLGVGLGLSSVSPWSLKSASADAIGVGTIVWLVFMALAASGLGGYLAGRLRARWPEAHVDEVYFRDTAHGLLAWSVATLVSAGVLTSTIGSIVGPAAQAGSGLAAAGTATSIPVDRGSAASAEGQGPVSSPTYFADKLLRPAATSAASAPAGVANDPGIGSPREITTVFARAKLGAALPADDVQYLSRLVAQRTGMSQQDAEGRVAETYAKAQQEMQQAEETARQAADKARKAAAYAALWVFVSLLLGAFSSSWFATIGGRQRDL